MVMWRSCSKTFDDLPSAQMSNDPLTKPVSPRWQQREERTRMVAETIQSRGLADMRVLGAMANVPRHEFVPSHLRALAYSDQPLPLGDGQTISQPYIVALMTALAELRATDNCLEIGTGSGYQTAVLAELCEAVFTVEVRPPLGQSAQSRLERLGYTCPQVRFKIGDGTNGWQEFAPYEAIIVTAAPEHVPTSLLEQLAMNGRLIVPVGPTPGVQRLEKWVRRSSGTNLTNFERTSVLDVKFVPMQSEADLAH
jgi:protein-L-isoaspartate(D-aspartate) O-methyltransferase